MKTRFIKLFGYRFNDSFYVLPTIRFYKEGFSIIRDEYFTIEFVWLVFEAGIEMKIK